VPNPLNRPYDEDIKTKKPAQNTPRLPNLDKALNKNHQTSVSEISNAT